MNKNTTIKILSVLFDGILLMLLTIFLYLGLPIASTTTLTVPQGSISGIIAQLAREGFDVNELDIQILRLLGKPQKGEIDIRSAQTPFIAKGDFLYALISAKAAQVSITLIPGETMYFFVREIASKLHLDIQKLLASYARYAPYTEGVILPDTYKIHANATEDTLMYILVSQSLQAHKHLARTLMGHYDEKQWFYYVSMASIVQKEAANIQEMPIIAAVIYNRLARNMPLQMDGALNYGHFSHSKVTPERIRTDTSPYNTYRHKGIPPSPVGSASIDAIKSVFTPARVDYLYFVRNKNGTHSFSKTFKEHRDNFHR